MAAAAVVAALALGFNAPMAPKLQQPRLHAPLAPHRAAHLTMADPWSTGGGGSDVNQVIGGAAALFGAVAGVGLIAFTENAGKRNDATKLEQPCVVCDGKKVVPCTICSGALRPHPTPPHTDPTPTPPHPTLDPTPTLPRGRGRLRTTSSAPPSSTRSPCSSSPGHSGI